MNTSLQRKIMRRIYYAYALRTAGQPAVLHGFFMLSLLIILTYFVSLGNVLTNLMSNGLTHVPTFLFHALLNTEAWTLLIIGVLVFSVISLRFTLGGFGHKVQFVRA